MAKFLGVVITFVLRAFLSIAVILVILYWVGVVFK